MSTSTSGVISSQGLGSGLDIAGIVSKLMSIEQIPLTNLQKQEASYQTTLTAWGTLQSTLAKLQTDAGALAKPASFSTATASSSDSSVVSVTSLSSATVGSYNLAVEQLAKANQISTSNRFQASDTFDAGALHLTLNGATTDISIAADSTLAQIASAINSANAGVTASLVDQGMGSGESLVLLANNTGSNSTISLTSTTTGSSSTNALTAITDHLQTNQVGQDALFYVNGTPYMRPTNTLSDVLDGVSLTLNKGDSSLTTPYTAATAPASAPSSAATATVAVTQSNNSAATLINQFVTDYNAVIKLIGSDTQYDTSTNTASVFTGDNTVNTIKSQLERALFTQVSGVSGTVSNLSDLGISINKDGSLSLDSGVLNAALANGANDIKSLFSQSTLGNSGIGVAFQSILSGMLDSNSGLIPAAENNLNGKISDNQAQQARLQDYLNQEQANLNAEYNAMDTLVGQMKNLQSQLTAELAALPGFTTLSGKNGANNG